MAAVSFLGLNPHTAVFVDMGCGASTPAPDAAKSGEAPVAAKSGKAAGAAKSGKAPVAAQSAEDKQYGPVIKGHEAAIKTLFKKIDVDNDGHLIASELKDVVAKYTGEAFDEKQFFEWFDVHGAGGAPDSQLDLKEFGWYIADLCEGFDAPHTAVSGVIRKFEELLAGPEATRYGPIIEGHEAAIEALFKKIDADGDGHLVASELKNVIAKYTGEAFDEKQFFGWFDVHGASGAPDNQLDLKEFGWYVADIAEGFGLNPTEKVGSIIDELSAACS